MNPNEADILACAGLQDKAFCSTNDKCKWYRGKIVAANDNAVVGQPAGDNFCHPPTTVNWDTQGPYCLAELNKGQCESKGCMWSTGNVLNPDHDVCYFASFTQDA
jgi:hypothetical protein